MAKKKAVTPSGIPQQINLLAKAINCEDENLARLIVNQVLKIVRGNDVNIQENEIESVISLISACESKNIMECTLAAQYAVFFLLGMATLSQNYVNSKGHGMMLLRMSQQTYDMLMKYRIRQVKNAVEMSDYVQIDNELN